MPGLSLGSHPIITEKLLEAMFSVVSAPTLYNEEPRPGEFSSRIFAGQ
jgi:hypothetical protein